MSSIGPSSRSPSGRASGSRRADPRAGSIGIVLHDLSLGGTERIALRLAGRWADEGRAVTLVVGAEEGPLRPMVPANVRLIALDPPIRRGRGSRARLAKACASVVADLRPDMMFIPGNFHWPVVQGLARLPAETRPRIVAQISAPLRRADRVLGRQALFDARARRQLAGADAMVALSEAMVTEADRIFEQRRTTRIPLPALDDDVAPPRPTAAGRIILGVGRLVKEKGFVTAVDAFARLGDASARLIILGEGPQRGAILAAARRLGVEKRVTLAGFVPDSRPWLDRARMLLLTSDFEGYGAVIVEALAAGRPVVATNCSPSISELVLPGHGAVAPVGDAAALAEAMRDVLDSRPPDPFALAALVADYRLGPVAKAYLALFDAVCAR